MKKYRFTSEPMITMAGIFKISLYDITFFSFFQFDIIQYVERKYITKRKSHAHSMAKLVEISFCYRFYFGLV